MHSLRTIVQFSCLAAMSCFAMTGVVRAGAPVLSPLSEKQRADSYQILRQFMSQVQAPRLHEKCGLPAITYAIDHRATLPPAVASALQVVESRPSTQKSIRVGAFRIHYDTVGVNAPAMLDSSYNPIPGTSDQFADSVGAIANYCENVETNILGYLPSPKDSLAGGGPEYDIYVTSLGDYGYTTPDSVILAKPNGGTYTSFITVDNLFQFVTPPVNRGLPALRVTLAHELHHSIQIGNYGYWTNDIYFYELTSVWMEDVVFHGVNDYYQYVNSPEGHFNNPGVPFNTNSFIMYSRAIWAHYIAKKFGRDAMRDIWDEIRSAPPLEAINQALGKVPYGSSFAAAFAEWNVWNYFTGSRADTVLYYPEGKAYAQVNPLTANFTPPSSTVAGSLEELGSAYYNITSGSEYSPFVVSNVNLTAAFGGDLSAFPFQFSMTNMQPGEAALWSNIGIYVAFSAPDASNWYTALLTGAGQLFRPYPDPFRPDGSHLLSLPTNSPIGGTGLLCIYSSDMTLVYSATLNSRYSALVGGQVFEWNGVTSKNTVAASGVYLYLIQLRGGIIKGKFAIIRR